MVSHPGDWKGDAPERRQKRIDEKAEDKVSALVGQKREGQKQEAKKEPPADEHIILFSESGHMVNVSNVQNIEEEQNDKNTRMKACNSENVNGFRVVIGCDFQDLTVPDFELLEHVDVKAQNPHVENLDGDSSPGGEISVEFGFVGN